VTGLTGADLSKKGKLRRALTLGSLFIFLVAPLSVPAEVLNIKEAKIQVYFSPGGGTTDAIVREIGSAKKEILLQAYTLSSQPIVKALLDANRRGVKVSIIVDKSEQGEGLTPIVVLHNAGVPVFLDGKHIVAHTSSIVIDRATVVTGSFTFTKAAEDSNAENLLIIKATRLAEAYRDFWEKHRTHSEEP
jgi:phosphatidylserine/phosphatidylglycerophosphate/cardiolipin synthase-like enzyme